MEGTAWNKLKVPPKPHCGIMLNFLRGSVDAYADDFQFSGNKSLGRSVGNWISEGWIWALPFSFDKCKLYGKNFILPVLMYDWREAACTERILVAQEVASWNSLGILHTDQRTEFNITINNVSREQVRYGLFISFKEGSLEIDSALSCAPKIFKDLDHFTAASITKVDNMRVNNETDFRSAIELAQAGQDIKLYFHRGTNPFLHRCLSRMLAEATFLVGRRQVRGEQAKISINAKVMSIVNYGALFLAPTRADAELINTTQNSLTSLIKRAVNSRDTAPNLYVFANLTDNCTKPAAFQTILTTLAQAVVREVLVVTNDVGWGAGLNRAVIAALALADEEIPGAMWTQVFRFLATRKVFPRLNFLDDMRTIVALDLLATEFDADINMEIDTGFTHLAKPLLQYCYPFRGGTKTPISKIDNFNYTATKFYL